MVNQGRTNRREEGGQNSFLSNNSAPIGEFRKLHETNLILESNELLELAKWLPKLPLLFADGTYEVSKEGKTLKVKGTKGKEIEFSSDPSDRRSRLTIVQRIGKIEIQVEGPFSAFATTIVLEAFTGSVEAPPQADQRSAWDYEEPRSRTWETYSEPSESRGGAGWNSER